MESHKFVYHTSGLEVVGRDSKAPEVYYPDQPKYTIPDPQYSHHTQVQDVDEKQARRKRGRWLWLLAAIALLLGIGIGAGVGVGASSMHGKCAADLNNTSNAADTYNSSTALSTGSTTSATYTAYTLSSIISQATTTATVVVTATSSNVPAATTPLQDCSTDTPTFNSNLTGKVYNKLCNIDIPDGVTRVNLAANFVVWSFDACISACDAYNKFNSSITMDTVGFGYAGVGQNGAQPAGSCYCMSAGKFSTINYIGINLAMLNSSASTSG